MVVGSTGGGVRPGVQREPREADGAREQVASEEKLYIYIYIYMCNE